MFNEIKKKTGYIIKKEIGFGAFAKVYQVQKEN
jgi:hypothetical protein